MHLTICCVIGLAAAVAGELLDIQKYKQFLLEESNKYRKMAKASNMNKLVWDDQLAKEAADWISQCDFKHQVKGRGENLAFMKNKTATVEQMTKHSMQGWYDEINTYNYAGKACSYSCHYTQVNTTDSICMDRTRGEKMMVWAKTRKIGCAMNKCDSLMSSIGSVKDAFYLACFYDPMGNDISEFPYLKGEGCTACNEGQGCEDGFCTGKGITVCENTDKMCNTWAEEGDCKDEKKKYMKKDCRKACNLCDSDDIVKEEQCADEKGKNCEKYLWTCKNPTEFMKINCRKTCKLC